VGSEYGDHMEPLFPGVRRALLEAFLIFAVTAVGIFAILASSLCWRRNWRSDVPQLGIPDMCWSGYAAKQERRGGFRALLVGPTVESAVF
jgi:hypothetical protein